MLCLEAKQDALIFLYSFQTAGRKGHGSLVTLFQCQDKLNTFKTILSTFIFTVFKHFSSFPCH